MRFILRCALKDLRGAGKESARYLESPSTVMDVSNVMVMWFLCGLGVQ